MVHDRQLLKLHGSFLVELDFSSWPEVIYLLFHCPPAPGPRGEDRYVRIALRRILSFAYEVTHPSLSRADPPIISDVILQSDSDEAIEWARRLAAISGAARGGSSSASLPRVYHFVLDSFEHVAPTLLTLRLGSTRGGGSDESLTCTPEHPFFVVGVGFVPAGSPRAGDVVATRDGRGLLVESIQPHSRACGYEVYNFEVEGDHTYFVGRIGGGVWVHNWCGVTADEIRAINRGLGGSVELTGVAESAAAAAEHYSGFWSKTAAIVREIAGRHLFNDANKRTALRIVEILVERNGVRTGVSGPALRAVIGRVARGELRDVPEIARALRGF